MNRIKSHYSILALVMVGICLISTIRITDGAKILGIFPMASYSHQQPALALARALAAKGHNLTIITTDPNPEPLPNLREVSIRFMYERVSDIEHQKKTGFLLSGRATSMQMINGFANYFNGLAGHIFSAPNVQDLIKELNGTKYDLILKEPILFPCLLGFSDLVGNPPIVGVISFDLLAGLDYRMGNPLIHSYINCLFGAMEDFKSIVNRLINTYYDINLLWQTMKADQIQEELMQQNFGNYRRKLSDLTFNYSLLISSLDLSMTNPRPIQPNTIFVGPLHIHKNPEPLPQDLQKWADESNGLIYFSFGSNMKGYLVSQEIREMFIKAFSRLQKYRVLWKWESDSEFPGKPKNVLLNKWIPQQSLLKHPKTVLFITQCGLQSIQEAIYYGVPMLGVPFFADQDSNSLIIKNSGAGLIMQYEQMTADELYNNLYTLLTNSSYKEKIKRQSSIMQDKQLPAIDNAVWWVEYVLRHKGAPHLRPRGLDLQWYQLYMFDIYAIVLFTLLLTAFIIYYMTKHLFRFIVNYFSVKDKQA